MKTTFSDYAQGAGVATDLVNTASLVRAAGDVLIAPADLGRFLDEHGISPVAPLDRRDLQQVRALREHTRAIMETDEDETVRGASALLARVDLDLRLERDGDQHWQWHVTTAPGASIADDMAVLIGTGLLGVVRALGHSRFRACASSTCNGVFVDVSKAGRRRYCMPEICGNRLNVAKHRARQRSNGETLNGA